MVKNEKFVNISEILESIFMVKNEHIKIDYDLKMK